MECLISNEILETENLSSADCTVVFESQMSRILQKAQLC